MQTPTSCSSKGESTVKRCIDSTTKLPLEKPSKIPKTEEESESLSSNEEEEAEEDQKLMVKNPRAQRYLVAIEYIGTRFCGSQKQPNCRTVVGALEKAFLQFIGQPVSVSISSRTDAGVHALSNVCHVDVERISKRKPGEVLPAHEPGVVRRAVNHFLQKNEGDITVIDVRCIPSDFHARFRALERTYFYRLLSGPEHVSTFERDRAWHVPEDLDLASMQNACKVLVGSHDFSSFRAAGCQAKSPIRILDELSISEVASNPYFPSVVESGQSSCIEQDLQNCSCSSETKFSIDGSVPNSDIAEGFSTSHGQGFGQLRSHRSFVVKARARAFLYHQVRLLVGVLKCAGTGNLTTGDVERILNAKDVAAACPMAPAYGLYLGNVKYDLP